MPLKFLLVGIDDTFVLLAVLLNYNYCCRFSNGSVDYYGTTWHNTFLALWIAALRLVQRLGIDL